eukprot:1136973-Pelagomonas_calceolata.AAC.14
MSHTHLLASQDAAEFGRIGRYYAVESMLVWDPVRQQYLPDATPRWNALIRVRDGPSRLGGPCDGPLRL